MKKHFIQLLTAVCCIWAVDANAKIIIESPPDVPPGINSRDFKELTATRETLITKFNETQQKIDKQAENCRNVEKGSDEAKECIAEAQNIVKPAVKEYRTALKPFKSRLAMSIAWQKAVSDMNAKTSTGHNPNAVAVESQGEFQIVTADGKKLSEQDAGNLTIDSKGRFITGPDGGAILRFSDGTFLRLGPNSVFVMNPQEQKPDPDGNRPVMELVKGKLKWLHEYTSELKKTLNEPAIGGGRKIKIGLVYGAVRGTEFDCLAMPDGSGNIKLYSGEVSITSENGEVVTLKPGQMLSFTKEKVGAVMQIEEGGR